MSNETPSENTCAKLQIPVQNCFDGNTYHVTLQMQFALAFIVDVHQTVARYVNSPGSLLCLNSKINAETG